MTDFQRSRKQVIKQIIKSVDKINYSAIAVAPIPSVTDKHNEQPGDYYVRIGFVTLLPNDTFFINYFNAFFPMEVLRECDPARFKRNMRAIYKGALDYKNLPNDTNIAMTTDGDIRPMSELLAESIEELLSRPSQTKH